MHIVKRELKIRRRGIIGSRAYKLLVSIKTKQEEEKLTKIIDPHMIIKKQISYLKF